jgi:hypothetical protein
MGSACYTKFTAWLLLTYPGLANLRKNITETLYTSINSPRVNIESPDSLLGLFTIKIEVRMKHVEIEWRPSRRES